MLVVLPSNTILKCKNIPRAVKTQSLRIARLLNTPEKGVQRTTVALDRPEISHQRSNSRSPLTDFVAMFTWKERCGSKVSVTVRALVTCACTFQCSSKII